MDDYYEYKIRPKVEIGNINDITELYQTDFDNGPYRITKSGTYKLMEDIVFNFNFKDSEDVDSVLEDDSWWPTSDQANDYPGSGDTNGAYDIFFFVFLFFFEK